MEHSYILASYKLIVTLKTDYCIQDINLTMGEERMTVKPTVNVEIIPIDNLIFMVENSVGNSLFKTRFAYVDGVKKDILKGGELSCAVFTSSILVLRGLLHKPHACVDSTVEDMIKKGWKNDKCSFFF